MRSIPPPGSESYWAEFELNEADLTFIDNLLLERGIPLTPKEMAEVIVRDRLQGITRTRSNARITNMFGIIP